MRRRQILTLAVCFLAAGCSDRVLFVTDTSIGFNVETKPVTASIAYDRTEGYIGPRYDNGAIPPVIGVLQTGGTVFNPAIRQFYATGDAALIASQKAAGETPTPSTNKPLTGSRKLAFFGTSTSLGVKVGFENPASLPDSILIGYRRREASFIPLGTQKVDGVDVDTYASALASIDSNTTTAVEANPGPKAVGLSATQFFATGIAAEVLARDPDVAAALDRAARNAASKTLSAADNMEVIAMVDANQKRRDESLEKITKALDAAADFPTVQKTLIANANPKLGEGSATTLGAIKSKQTFLHELYSDYVSANAIAAGIP